MKSFSHSFVTSKKIAVLSLAAGLLTVLSPVAAQAQTAATVLGATALGNSILTPGNPIGTTIGSIFGATPSASSLAGQAGAVTAADAECNPVNLQCGCNLVPDPKHPGSCIAGTNMNKCPCTSVTNGFTVTGMCVAQTRCQGVSSQGLNGQTSSLGGGLNNLLQGLMAAQLLQSLLNNSGATQPPAAPAPTTGTTGTTGAATGCTTTYYQTATLSSDPCAIYTPGLANTNPTTDLLNALGEPSTTCPVTQVSCAAGFTAQTQIGTDANGCELAPICVANSPTSSTPQTSCPTVTASCPAGYTDQPSSGVDQNGCALPDQCILTQNQGLASTTAFVEANAPAPALAQPEPGQGGVSGNIQVTSSGTTFFATNEDMGNNSATASFIGSDSTGLSQPQGVVGQWCQSRPWASNFLSYIIPPSFFDSLCSLGGYQVGLSTTLVNAQAPTPEASLQQVVQEAPPAAPAPAPTTPVVQPSVEIWAVPASVSIGQRTSIFWNTQGVVSCTETSPDGSFSQNSLSGGASTVPLTEATTYTISCLDTQNNPVTGYVTVNIGS